MRQQDDELTAETRPEDPGAKALIAAMEESMERFGETYRLLATEALSDDPNP